ncbi:hypothetical protein AAMO2058_000782000 [Amorphochlora amoebiformis]
MRPLVEHTFSRCPDYPGTLNLEVTQDASLKFTNAADSPRSARSARSRASGLYSPTGVTSGRKGKLGNVKENMFKDVKKNLHSERRKSLFAYSAPNFFEVTSKMSGAPVCPYKRFTMEWMIYSYHIAYVRIQSCSQYLFALSITGIIALIVQKELEFNGMWNVGQFLRILVFIDTCAIQYFLFLYYSLSHYLKTLSETYLHSVPFWATEMAWTYVIEVIVCLFCDIPFYDYSISNTLEERTSYENGDLQYSEHKLVNGLSLLMFLRVYLVFRMVTNRYYRPGLRIIGSWFDFQFDQSFTIRNLLHWNPTSVLLLFWCYITIVLGYCMYYCERDVNPHLAYYSSSVYLAIVTGYTVGYGDTFPVTPWGRAIAIVALIAYAMFNAVLVSTITSHITRLKPFESKMLEFMQDVQLRRGLRNAAARVIQVVLRLYIARSKDKPKSFQYYLYAKLIGEIRIFVRFRKALKFGEKTLEHPQVMMHRMDCIRSQMESIGSQVRRLKPGLFVRGGNPSVNKRHNRPRTPRHAVPEAVAKVTTFLKRHRSISQTESRPPPADGGRENSYLSNRRDSTLAESEANIELDDLDFKMPEQHTLVVRKATRPCVGPIITPKAVGTGFLSIPNHVLNIDNTPSMPQTSKNEFTEKLEKEKGIGMGDPLKSGSSTPPVSTPKPFHRKNSSMDKGFVKSAQCSEDNNSPSGSLKQVIRRFQVEVNKRIDSIQGDLKALNSRIDEVLMAAFSREEKMTI